jgi:hypothetical protein
VTRRPRVTPSDALLLFVTEPQQLDAVFEYGTETLSPDSIRVARERVEQAIASEQAALDAGEHLDGWLCDASSECDDDECIAYRENERALDEDADRYEEV